jgi:hypothetical protein
MNPSPPASARPRRAATQAAAAAPPRAPARAARAAQRAPDPIKAARGPRLAARPGAMSRPPRWDDLPEQALHALRDAHEARQAGPLVAVLRELRDLVEGADAAIGRAWDPDVARLATGDECRAYATTLRRGLSRQPADDQDSLAVRLLRECVVQCVDAATGEASTGAYGAVETPAPGAGGAPDLTELPLERPLSRADVDRLLAAMYATATVPVDAMYERLRAVCRPARTSQAFRAVLRSHCSELLGGFVAGLGRDCRRAFNGVYRTNTGGGYTFDRTYVPGYARSRHGGSDIYVGLYVLVQTCAEVELERQLVQQLLPGLPRKTMAEVFGGEVPAGAAFRFARHLVPGEGDAEASTMLPAGWAATAPGSMGLHPRGRAVEIATRSVSCSGNLDRPHEPLSAWMEANWEQLDELSASFDTTATKMQTLPLGELDVLVPVHLEAALWHLGLLAPAGPGLQGAPATTRAPPEKMATHLLMRLNRPYSPVASAALMGHQVTVRHSLYHRKDATIANRLPVWKLTRTMHDLMAAAATQRPAQGGCVLALGRNRADPAPFEVLQFPDPAGAGAGAGAAIYARGPTSAPPPPPPAGPPPARAPGRQ